MTLVIDRMALDEVGANPDNLARAVLEQIGHRAGPTPIEAIAAAVDIIEIRQEQLNSFEGALITTLERDVGKILVNRTSSRRRQRFSVAHELGHYLNPWHVPTSSTGFWCKKRDFLAVRRSSDLDRQLRQEAEANTFAIALLAPASLVRRHLSPQPDLADVVAISNDMDISREAAARRYVEVRDETLAVLVSRDGRLVYLSLSREFPKLAFQRDDVLPEPPDVQGGTGVSEVDDADPRNWLRIAGGALTAQTLRQRNGWAITLLHHTTGEDNERPVEDSFDRYSGFDRDR